MREAIRSSNSSPTNFAPAEVIANHLGKRLDEDNPLLHAQLPYGSLIAAVVPPVVRPSPALTIRKFTSRRFTIDDLIARGTLSRSLADYLIEQISLQFRTEMYNTLNHPQFWRSR